MANGVMMLCRRDIGELTDGGDDRSGLGIMSPEAVGEDARKEIGFRMGSLACTSLQRKTQSLNRISTMN